MILHKKKEDNVFKKANIEKWKTFNKSEDNSAVFAVQQKMEIE
jgi:hypothetical protein